MNPILYQGATPVLIDSEMGTWSMSPQALERALKEALENDNLPKAVIVVYLYGQSAQMDELITICDTYGVYSFNGNKIITTSGGGAPISNEEGALQKARFLATQARDQAIHYQHSEIGYNYRMSNIVAGIGRGQLEVLDERVNQRRAVFKR